MKHTEFPYQWLQLNAEFFPFKVRTHVKKEYELFPTAVSDIEKLLAITHTDMYAKRYPLVSIIFYERSENDLFTILQNSTYPIKFILRKDRYVQRTP